MKTFLLTILFILINTICFARDYNFRWQPNIDPDLAGYNIYRREVGEEYSSTPRVHILCRANDDTCTKATDYNVDPNILYYYVATAFDDEGFESEYSEEADTSQADPLVSEPIELMFK